MITTYRWMSEILGFHIDPQEMIDRLIMIGHEVEETVDLGFLGNPICIARIEKVEPHPAAMGDEANEKTKNLTICEVDAGNGEKVSVVCGAANAREGVITVLAKVGATLPNGMKLESALVRGVESNGMLLAEDELGLGNDHSGIIELEPDAKVGEPYDLIMTLEITPNRPDCLSVLGLARDLAASYAKKVYFHADRLKETFENAHDMVTISIRCPEDCPQYTARVIRNVQIAQSPNWLRRRLLAVGLRPINNVVDITNYVLMEMGHPLHAFDLEKLRKNEIIVRKAAEGEKIRLIDESELELKAGEDMVIADGIGPVALAGIMGGGDSEVTQETENVLLESAYFKPTRIRRSAKDYKLSTDASYRFERGADSGILEEALDRAAGLIGKLADGKIAKGVINNHAKRLEKPLLMFRSERALQFLGVEMSKTEIADIIASIGCEIVRMERDILVLSVPTHRVDISREEDIFEEIARLYGYNKIESTAPYLPAMSNPLHPEVYVRRLIQDILVQMGFSEALHMSLIGADQLEELGLEHEKVLKLLNPLSREQEVLRPSLVPSMLRTLAYNQNRGITSMRLFEASKVFRTEDSSLEKRSEPARLMLAGMGSTSNQTWRDQVGEPFDFFHMKGVLETFLKRLGIGSLRIERGGPEFLHPGRSAKIFITHNDNDKVEIGWMGELNPFHREKLDLKMRPVIVELDVEQLAPAINLERYFTEIPRYPAIDRDLALIVDADTPAAEIEEVIRSTSGELLESLFLFDCYMGEQVGEGKKSLGYRAIYRCPDRTLKDKEVDAIQKEILERLAKEKGASLRE